MADPNTIKPIYIVLYYSLLLDKETPIPSYSVTNYICSEPESSFANITTQFMINADGKRNNNLLTYLNFRSPANTSLLIPPLFYEYLYILTPNNDSIQAFSNYIDTGATVQTTIPSQIFVVTATNGIFDGATIIKIIYNDDLTRKVIITNEDYINSLPKELQIIPQSTKELLLISDEPTEIILYYSTILSKQVPINNSSVLEISNLAPTLSYSVMSNRYMQNEDGTQNNNIITYLTYRIPGDSALEILPQISETLIIITPNDEDKIQAVSVYTDLGVGEITTNAPYQDFLVNGAFGIFQGAKNVRVFYNNDDLNRKVVITNYYPNPNLNITNKLPISLYYASIISPLVPITNFTTTGFQVYTQAETFGGVNCRYMINDDFVRNDNILTLFQTRIAVNRVLGLPPISCIIANIRTPEGDTVNCSGVFYEITSIISPTTAFILLPVCSANGIFKFAKKASVFRNLITSKVTIIFS